MKNRFGKYTATAIMALFLTFGLVAGTSNFDAIQLDTGALDTIAIKVMNPSATPVYQLPNSGAFRSVSIPLSEFYDCQTDAGALLGFDTTADALADYVSSATDGVGRFIRFDATSGSEDQSSEICATISVPQDYRSAVLYGVRIHKAASTGATEILNCQVLSNNGSQQTAGTATITGTTSTGYGCVPTFPTLSAGDSLVLSLSVTSSGTMNDAVDVESVAFYYNALY